MMAIWVLIFFCLNLIMAGLHAEIIKKGKKIKHGLWGAGYLVAAGLVSHFGNSWELAVCLLVLRKWSFDLALNVFRGKPTFYVSAKPASIIDKVHNKIFGLNSIPYMVFYFIATIVLTWQMLIK